MDPEDARLMDTDWFLCELTARRPFLSTNGLELCRRCSPSSILDTEKVLSLVMARYVTEGVGQPKVSRLDVLQWRDRRNDRLNFVERALYKMGLIALKMYEFEGYLITMFLLEPLDINACFCEHEEPEVHVPRQAVYGGHGVVHQHTAIANMETTTISIFTT